ncbi:MAG: hypothetical protein MR384_13290 [Lachnospiraceae bacterium]|nr:hypothetical protein [Lachnospiraceae bacterium]
MTKEQEESIEYLKKHIKYFEEQIKFIEATDCDYYDEELELYQNRVKQFKTVLSMLEEKDKEIDKLKKHNDELLRKLRNRVKEVKKLEKYSLYKEEFSKLNKQLQNKDKQIDLMSEQLAGLTIFDIDKAEPLILGDKDDVKQYFEEKAKEIK